MTRTMCYMVALACVLGGCDGEKKPSKVDELVSAAKKEKKPEVPPERKGPDWKEMPSISIDDLGAYIGGFRADKLDKKEGQQKLKELADELPIETDTIVKMRVLPKAKMHDVVETIWALGKAGAKKVRVITKGRGDLPGEMIFVPQSQISEADECSLVAMVNDKADTGVWPFKGGGGKKMKKGFAGPDLSKTGDAMKDILKRCDSDKAFFSAAANMPWEHAYNLGALMKKVDEEGKLKSISLLGKEPVAGRAVELRK